MHNTITFEEAAASTATGDVWLFRGKTPADRAIRLFTNSPVNHVSMVLALDGLPPLLWHAELSARIPDVWTGTKQRFPGATSLAKRWLKGRVRRSVPLADLFCAELVAITYERMGLLNSTRPANWYDPGKFWSGDRLPLVGASLGREVEVIDIPTPDDQWFHTVPTQ